MNGEPGSETQPLAQSRVDKLKKLESTCFVIMPFGKKDVAGKQVDFNAIFEKILRPAIEAATTPEDKPLVAARTDMDAFSGSINQDMFEYIMYSRVAFADISGFNPNVFYEIGARHSAQEAGTVIFRQTGHAIPFDISSIKVFEYDHMPKARAEESRTLITNVLTESLKRNRLDSPVRLALRAQWGGESSPAPTAAPTAPAAVEAQVEAAVPSAERARIVERFLRDAEEALRLGDLELARTNYWVAVSLDPLNTIARMRLGLALKRQGKHHDALGEFTTVTKLAPDYGEAWKERGVIEGLIARTIQPEARPSWLNDGLSSLEKATQLIPDDFDAWASMGGLLKNVRNEPERAYEAYTHAAKISEGHPYPLLNALKLKLQLTGKLNLRPLRKQLNAAEQMRRAQTLTSPPTDPPWSFFDVAELCLYQGDKAGFVDTVAEGIRASDADWQLQTFRKGLQTLVDGGIDRPGLKDGIALLDKAAKGKA